MAADNVTLNSGSGGSTVRTLSDGTNEWQAVVPAYVTGGSAGAWTLQQVDTAHGLPVSVLGTVPVSGTFWQATQPVSAASLPLPAGASTSAKQPALGTAGSASADVLTVQGIASMTPLKVDGSAVTQPVSGTVTANVGTTGGLALDTSVNGILVGQGSTTSGEKGPLVQGAVTTASPAYTTGQTSPLSLTTAGALRVDGSAVTQPVSGTFWQATQPVSGTVTVNIGTGNLAGITGNVTVVGTGTFAVQAAQSGTWTVQPGNTQNTTPWLTADQAATAGGTSVYSFLSAAAVQSAAVKASAGQVYALHFFNNTGTIAYVRLYNQTTAPAAGDTANIVYRGLIPANTSGAGFVVPIPPGTVFGTGIGLRVTAGVADNDATALAASGVLGNVFYK